MKSNTLCIQSEIEDIKKTLSSIYGGQKRDLIDDAIRYLEQSTSGKTRKNREPEIIHPLKVALYTAEIGLGPNAIIAALLHDAIEDGDDKRGIAAGIQKAFGTDILALVTGLTELNSTIAEKSKTKEVEAAQQYLLATTPDLRIILIKLCDKRHNLETVEGLSPERQVGYREEVRQIYLPIAEYLGLGKLQWKLDELIFHHEYPEEARTVKDLLETHEAEHDAIVDSIIEEMRIILGELEFSTDIAGRAKSIPSIWKKIQKYSQKMNMSMIDVFETHIHDLVAFRILVPTKEDCFLTYSLVNQYYEQIELEDFITTPKENGYQSLHLISNHPKFGPFEIQIKTEAMHHYNEYGPASHIYYKRGFDHKDAAKHDLSWVEQLQKAGYYQTHTDKPIRCTALSDSVFVLTPNKDFIKLPRGATPIDLAYTIHTDIGNQCVEVRVNNRPVPIDTILESGDVVEIITNPRKKYASKSWLEFVVTTKAKNRILESVNRRMKNL